MKLLKIGIISFFISFSLILGSIVGALLIKRDIALESFIKPKLLQFFNLRKNSYKGSAELKKELEKSTVSVFSMGDGGLGTCSGTIVNEVDGNHHVLTAKHCIQRTDEFFVDYLPAKLIIASVDNDIAYIIVKGKIFGKKPAVIAKDSAYPGEVIHHLGYPEEEYYISSGFVTRWTRQDHFSNLPSRGGCSGGGIFNNKAEMIGVLWGGYDTFKNPKTIYEPVYIMRRFLKTIESVTGIEYKEIKSNFKIEEETVIVIN